MWIIPYQFRRSEVLRILKNSSWDGKVWGVQVTDTTEHSMKVRAIMSAPDSSSAWDLRCEVREKLIDFIRTKHPEAFPRFRAEFHGER